MKFSDKYSEYLQKMGQVRLEDDFGSENFASKITPDDYFHALTGGSGGPDSRYISNRLTREFLENSPQNNPENNSKVFNVLKRRVKNRDDESDDAHQTVEKLLQYGKLPNDVLEEASKGKEGIFGDMYDRNHLDTSHTDDQINYYLSRNDNLEDKDYKFLHEKNPKSVVGMFAKLPLEIKNSLINNPETLKEISGRDLRGHVNGEMLNPNPDAPQKFGAAEARSILNSSDHVNHLYGQEEFDYVLGKLPEVERKSFISQKLGIEGGEYKNKPSEYPSHSPEDFQREENWDNWDSGNFINDGDITKRLAGSKYLSDEHAEHIKRHGSFDDKYNLYNNPSVDPKHGVEMFRKWNQDHSTHGYSTEQLTKEFAKDKNKKNIYSIDDVEPDYWEEHQDSLDETARESAESDYDFHRWVRDEGINPWKDEDPSDHTGADEWISDHLSENHEWEDRNPDHDPQLEEIHQHILDHAPEERGWVKSDEAVKAAQDAWEKQSPNKRTRSKPKTLDDIGLADYEKDGEIHQSDIEEHSQKFNPEKIDYQNSDDKSINDHPEYDDRYSDAVNAWRDHQDDNEGHPNNFFDDNYEKWYESDGYQSALNEAMTSAKESHFEDEVLPELYGAAHQDDRFIPEHLKQHIPEYEQLKKQRELKIGDGANTSFLDKHIKERSREHAYGDDQHFYEMVKDHAKANGGSIDIGTMHKLFPNQKEKWKKVFGDKGKMSESEVDQKIAEIPKSKYGISFGKWDSSKMQNLNRRDEAVIRLDHSDESLKPIMENPDVYRTFQKVMDTSKRSGHPTKNNTIAWARVDMSDPKHWMVDELQSDFGKTVTQYLKKEGHHDKAEHIETIANHHKNWREALLNYITNEGKKHGVEKISTHSPESKAVHTGSGKTHTVYNDSYGKVPKSMGFKPSAGETLPLSDSGKRQLMANEAETPESRMTAHHEASVFHSGIAANIPKENPLRQHHESMAKQHWDKSIEHGNELQPWSGNVDKIATNYDSLDVNKEVAESAIKENKPATHENDTLFNQPLKEAKMHSGHTLDLTPKLLKHMIDVADALIKAEFLLVTRLSKNEETEELIEKIKYLRYYIGNEVQDEY